MSDIIKPKTVGYTIDKFCHIIGVIPSTYKYALTYEEQIQAIGEYLEKEIFPAINENAEALSELQGLFLQLKDYVDNYFDNLDVQEEINNKLDDMVTQGTMAEIINQEIFGELNSQVEQNTSDITKLKNQTVYVNVLAEGIKNDGTDVSSALQDLIDENTDGATFYFPNGTYLFKDIELNSNTTILGDTDTKFVIIDDNVNKFFIVENKSNIKFINCKFRNGSTNEQNLIGSATNKTQLKTCIYLDTVENLEIRNCEFNICSGANFVHLLDVTNALLENNVFNNSAYGQLMLYSNCKNILINKNNFKNTYTGSTGNSYMISTSVVDFDTDTGYTDGLTITNNVFENAVGWEAVDSHAGTNIKVSNNKFIECYIPINIFVDNRRVNDFDCENIYVTENYIKSTNLSESAFKGYAISVSGNSTTLKLIRNGKINNNTIILNSGVGSINVRQVDNFEICSNYVSKAYAQNLTLYNVINSIVENNIFKDCQTSRVRDILCSAVHNTVIRHNSTPSNVIPQNAITLLTPCYLKDYWLNDFYWSLAFQYMIGNVGYAQIYGVKGRYQINKDSNVPYKYATNEKLQSQAVSNFATCKTTTNSDIIEPSLNILDHVSVGENITIAGAGVNGDDIDVQILDFIDKDHVKVSQALYQTLTSANMSSKDATWQDMTIV